MTRNAVRVHDVPPVLGLALGRQIDKAPPRCYEHLIIVATHPCDQLLLVPHSKDEFGRVHICVPSIHVLIGMPSDYQLPFRYQHWS